MTRKFDKEKARRRDKVAANEDPHYGYDFRESDETKKRAKDFMSWRSSKGRDLEEHVLKHYEWRHILKNGELVSLARIDNGPMLPPDEFALYYKKIACTAVGKPLEII